MRKLLLSALLIPGAHLSAQADSVFKEIKELMDSFNKKFEAVEKYMNNFPEYKVLSKKDDKEKKSDQGKIVAHNKIEMTTNNEFVIIKLYLGELDPDKIVIDSFPNSLSGVVPLKNGEAKFYVKDRMFSISFEQTHKNEQQVENKGNDSSVQVAQSFFSSVGSKIQSLPAQVCDLENMVANYEDGVLELKLPRVPQKKGTKINVAKRA